MSLKVKLKGTKTAPTARCPVCHRQAPIKDGFYAEHESGSQQCSGTGKFVQDEADQVVTPKLKVYAALAPKYPTDNWSLYGDGPNCGVTQSILAKFLTCPEKMRLGVVEALETEFERKEAAEFGNFIHDALDAIYSGYKDADDKELYEMLVNKRIYAVVEKIYEIRKAELEGMESSTEDLELHSELAKVMLPIYFEKWEEDFDADWIDLEGVYSWTYNKLQKPVTIRLKIDGIKRSKVNGKLRIKDTKTKGQIVEDEIALKLPIDLQLMTYLLSWWKITGELPGGVEYDIIRRPQERRKAGENVYEYCLRVQANMAADPSHYLIRMQAQILKSDLEEFENRFDNYMQQLERWYLGEYHYLNPTACTGRGYKCPFLRICGSGDRQYYVKKESAFRELTSLGVKVVLKEEENLQKDSVIIRGLGDK